MSQITARAEVEPAVLPPPPALAEVALAAYRAGVLDARPAPAAPATVLHYAPTFLVYHVAPPDGPVPVAFIRPDKRRFTLAEVMVIAGRVLIGGGVADLCACLLTGGVSFLLALAPVGGALMVLAGGFGINREELGR
ncbi:MAG TPA: hypothetical protein VGX23_14260 [Actinocrinis sp.]|nr:hypothetical protein [Actinocrinis sp.]